MYIRLSLYNKYLKKTHINQFVKPSIAGRAIVPPIYAAKTIQKSQGIGEYEVRFYDRGNMPQTIQNDLSF